MVVFWEMTMNLKSMFAAGACALVASAAMAAGPVVQPGGNLGALTPLPALFGALKSANDVGSTPFLDTYTFSLGATSDIYGTVGEFFGTVDFSGVSIDGLLPSLVTETTSGIGFSFTGLSAGNHILYVSGGTPAGFSSYTGSVYAVAAVPEPASLALLLGGLGFAGVLVLRRSK